MCNSLTEIPSCSDHGSCRASLGLDSWGRRLSLRGRGHPSPHEQVL